LEILCNNVSFWEYIIAMTYPELQNIVYGATGYPYPGWHDVCWGLHFCAANLILHAVNPHNEPMAGLSSGFGVFQLQGF